MAFDSDATFFSMNALNNHPLKLIVINANVNHLIINVAIEILNNGMNIENNTKRKKTKPLRIESSMINSFFLVQICLR